MIRSLAACAALGLAAGPAAAIELVLPQGARPISERSSPLGSYALPTGPFAGGTLPVRQVEGRVLRQSWRLAAQGQTTLQILAPLRDQLERAGFTIVLDCKDSDCGGFDFRFATEVVPAPDMYVDIRDYRFVSATGPAGAAVSLLVSGDRSASYVQVIYVTPVEAPAAAPSPVPEAPAPAAGDAAEAGGLAATLTAQGHVVLPDLSFASGADALDPGSYASLNALAAYLVAHPEIVIALVGHTDSIGDLAQNIALSKRRAESVRARLVEAYGIDPARVQAEGMGYLAPIASNLSPAGREANRRVEAILLSGS